MRHRFLPRRRYAAMRQGAGVLDVPAQYARQWEAVRSAALRSCRQCLVCDLEAHQAYPMDHLKETVTGEWPEAVVCLCGQCAETCTRMGRDDRRPPRRWLPVGLLRHLRALGLCHRVGAYLDRVREVDRLRAEGKRSGGGRSSMIDNGG